MITSERFKEVLHSENRIRASVTVLKETDINFPEGTWRAIAGRFNLTQGDSRIRATSSFLAYRKIYPDGYTRSPLRPNPDVVVLNGGPSSPASLHNAHLFSGPYRIRYREDGLPNSGDLVKNTGFLEYANVINIDPPDTGIGRVLDKENPHWAYGVEKSGEIIAACTESWRSFTHQDKTRTGLAIIGSSYNGGIGMTSTVLALIKRGIKPDALGIINGLYDARLNKYDNTFHSRPYFQDNFSTIDSFVEALAPMALTNAYYKDQHFGGESPEALYEEVSAFAHGTYLDALKTGYMRNEDVDRMAEYIGFSSKVIRDHNLRITPDFLRENLQPGKILSAIDPRQAFDPYPEVKIDPYVDRLTGQALGNLFNRNSASRGYPEEFRHSFDYQPTIVASPWEYSGLWADKHAYDAMEHILRACPEIRIVDFKGMYDLNITASSLRFWKEMEKRLGILHITHHYKDDVYKNLSPIRCVDIFTLRMGHQPNDVESNIRVIQVLSDLANTIR